MEGVDPKKDKKDKIASKKIKAKKKQPSRSQENPKKIKEIQENLRQASVQSKQSTNCESRSCTVYYNTTDPIIYSPTTDLFIAACTIV